ncbi:MAG: UTP--glucose-1-phosphate uridylyltransferase [Planctomycetota bacterium]|nr:UTP--glucose-1-phosphate uridylyltransferase [Planctomycetota bacterium]
MTTPAARVLEQAGQAHLVAHAQTLAPELSAAFLAGAAAFPWEALRASVTGEGPRLPELRPPQTLTFGRQANEPELVARVGRLGQGLLAGGRVAALLLAGGQGTRLGHDGPKGDVVFGPEPTRTLYRIHAERIAAASRRAGRPVPLFVLVSESTEAATRAAFADPTIYGLESDQVQILVQDALPALDDDGRALLAGPARLALSPDGHGGAFGALVRSGVLASLRAREIDVLTTFQVDNPLGRPLDPVMLGWMVERRLQAIGKAVRKATPDEQVGVFARDLRGRTRIVEYSELPAGSDAVPLEPSEAPLVMGSIAIHGFSVRWLTELAAAGLELPLHRARKRVPHQTPDGMSIEPAEPNAWKLERFLFDLFPETIRAEVHEVRREWEFAPVKNATGADSLVTARVLAEAEIRRWHLARGLPVPEQPALRPLEIDGPADA